MQPQTGFPQLQGQHPERRKTYSVSTLNHDVKSIVWNPRLNYMDKFQDNWDNPQYYNIETLKLLAASGLRAVAEVSR